MPFTAPGPFTRRRLCGALPALGWLLVTGCRRPTGGGPAQSLAREIESALAPLELDAEGLSAYCDLYVRHRGADALSQAPELDATRRYLLSSDLFVRPEGEDGPIRFRSFYDPYLGPCGNPLAGRPPTDRSA